MKKIKQRLTGRQKVLLFTGSLSVILGLVLVLVSNCLIGRLTAQNMAKRWSNESDVSQISCFFSREAGVDEDTILSFEHGLDKALEEASIVSDSENVSARLWVDAYSAEGKVTLVSERASMEVKAIGVGGDFFLFHPQKLLTGSYFSGSDLMRDYIIIDEDAAWQLFGSNDVAGQMVTIGGVPHVISGVIEREDGYFTKEAGLTSSVAYVSFESLEQYGTCYGLSTYELVMPNPVTGYAKKYVAEQIGVTENEIEIVENTTRYDWISRFKLLARFGTRSMRSKAIIYPYWENVARGYEDVLALLLVFMVLLFIYPALILLIVLIRAWRQRTWTLKSVWHTVKDKAERFMEKWREYRQKQKEQPRVKKEKNLTHHVEKKKRGGKA